jgi:indolepyruvate ferredoxin oxidoreductase beta subunit
MTQPISILLCALGGEGGGVLTEWLIDVARHAGYAAQATSVPGVAQRTGATTYYLEVFPTPVAQLQGRRPVFGLNPLPGKLDLLVSSELLETARQVGYGLTSQAHTLVISSTARALTTLEKMQMGDGRQDDAVLQQTIRSHSRAQRFLDMSASARRNGTVVSSVMLGAVAASGMLPFARSDYEAVLQATGSSAQASLKGFAAAFDETVQYVSDDHVSHKIESDEVQKNERSTDIEYRKISEKDKQNSSCQDNFIALGHARVTSYQNAAYGRLFMQRVQALQVAEQAADPSTQRQGALAQEAARWLALWMAYDDIVRVADLKSRSSRSDRVRTEVNARHDDLLKVYEHFKPGVAEFASVLPQGLAKHLLAWDARRVAAGKQAWALPLKVGSHSVSGMLALRFLACLKWLRPTSSRFAAEQALIDRWLAAVQAGTRADWALGMALAECGRLIKGYGSTNERAKHNLLHIVDQLAQPERFATSEGCALTVAAVRAARDAALKDEAGTALDSTLRQHGAAPRPLTPQHIRWVKKPPARQNA